jgi:putative CocE/NonD family hydrolase
MAPAMTLSSPRNFFYLNGVFDLSWLPWIYVNIAPDTRARLHLDGITDVAEAAQAWPSVADAYRSFVPLSALPYLRDVAPYYFTWLQHPPEDLWWDWAEIRGRYAKVGAAVLNLSGWHDESYGPEGAVSNHNGITDSRGGVDAARSHLIIGPWIHGVRSTGEAQVGDIDFGPDAAIDYDEVLLAFFDKYLRDSGAGTLPDAPVHYFLMGANEWRSSTSWPPAGTTPRTLWFSRDGDAGVLSAVAEQTSTDSSGFVADPAKPLTDPYGTFGPHDLKALANRADVLTFDSNILQNKLTIAGSAAATLFVSCDCRDFDLWARLLDVYPDGRAYNLMSPGADVLRASYRDIARDRQLLTSGEVYELKIDGLLTANEFAAGHRVRVQISASFAPHLSRNPQTGKSETDTAILRRATITLHHNAGFPSSLTLPVQ